MPGRKFRFGVQVARPCSREEWQAKARKMEELGYATLFLPDHFPNQLAPVPAMMAAADATANLRVGTMVLGNDYRHPLMLAMEAATLDILSGGRLELGIGAGWMRVDYDAAGLTYDRAGVRIERLAESLAVLKGLFGEGAFSFSGKHYTIAEHDGQPKPLQKPHPPILIGGGARRVLSLAAREADIISINFNLEPGEVNAQVLATGGGEATDEKIGWIRKAAGARFDEIELNAVVFTAIVTDDQQAMAERLSAAYTLPPADVLDSPHALVGSLEQMAETLERRRERYGISYVVFQDDRFEQLAPIVKRLAGT
jgi:probable F420-dependent oxidoreductase